VSSQRVTVRNLPTRILAQVPEQDMGQLMNERGELPSQISTSLQVEQ